MTSASPFGRLTPQRRLALELLVSRYPEPVQRGYATHQGFEGQPTISLHHANWLLENGLAEPYYGTVSLALTSVGIRVASELGLELPDGRRPSICQEWSCERKPVPGGRFCKAHGGRR